MKPLATSGSYCRLPLARWLSWLADCRAPAPPIYRTDFLPHTNALGQTMLAGRQKERSLYSKGSYGVRGTHDSTGRPSQYLISSLQAAAFLAGPADPRRDLNFLVFVPLLAA